MDIQDTSREEAMIEKTVLDYLNDRLDVPVWMEIPKGEVLPEEYVLLEKTGSRRSNHIDSVMMAIQSHADRMENAALLNEEVKQAMDDLIVLDEIGSSKLNSDYNFTDTQKKKYRYQAVYEITHH